MADVMSAVMAGPGSGDHAPSMFCCVRRYSNALAMAASAFWRCASSRADAGCVKESMSAAMSAKMKRFGVRGVIDCICAAPVVGGFKLMIWLRG